MGTPKCIYFWLLFAVVVSFVTACRASKDGYEDNVRTQCGFTRYPTLCAQTLTGLGSKDILSTLVNGTISESKLPGSNFEVLSSHFISPEAQLVRSAMDYCHELMEMSRKSLQKALDALQKSPQHHKGDIQTWLSGALTFQQACRDSVEHHVPSNAYMAEIYKKMDYLAELVSNPLALVNRITAKPKVLKKSPTGRRVLENQDFPDWVSARDRKLLQTTEIKANAIVAKDGSGNFKTVSEAIQAATGSRFVIYVKAGTYNERINTKKAGITLIGDGKYSTIITGSGSHDQGSSLRETATFSIFGDGFIAKDIGFQNTAGPGAGQAIALTVASDHAVLYRCSLAGYQDTLYTLALRQFYRECDIYGTVDFIFGNSAAVFQSCSLTLRGGSYNVIMANGRTDPGQNTGFSVQNCKITAGSSSEAYLGRPWKQYSRAVVLQSNIDGGISSQGWDEWPGASSSTYKSLYFAEYGNMGPGASVSGRVKWPGFRVIDAPEASKFTVANLIGGNSWLPSTGVAYTSGL